VDLGLSCCRAISSSDVNLTVLYHGNRTCAFFSIVLFNPDDAVQPRIQWYLFFFQNKDNFLPQKGAKYKETRRSKNNLGAAIQYHPSHLSRKVSYDK